MEDAGLHEEQRSLYQSFGQLVQPEVSCRGLSSQGESLSGGAKHHSQSRSAESSEQRVQVLPRACAAVPLLLPAKPLVCCFSTPC